MAHRHVAIIARVPAALTAGKPLPERVELLTALATPFAEILDRHVLAWRYGPDGFALEARGPFQPEGDLR